jgi:DNA invertase Pin-like site-specific DNA recombinase
VGGVDAFAAGPRRAGPRRSQGRVTGRYVSVTGAAADRGFPLHSALLIVTYSQKIVTLLGANGMSKKEKTKAFAYLRTSSAANVGANKDSDKRQREAIEAFARRNGVEIVEVFYDAAVSGADPVAGRPGFAGMLERIAGNGVRTIIVETASRFAGDLMVQEIGHKMLRDLGIELIAADSPDAFNDDTPTSKLIRQVLGAVSEFEKAMLVAKLKGARDRKRRTGAKVEGRKSLEETHPAAVALARELARKRKQPLSLRAISAALAEAGNVNERGKPYAAKSIAAMLR